MKLAGYYTLQEAAKVLGVSPSMVSRYTKYHGLPSISLGKQRIFEQSAVHNFRPNPCGNPNFRRIKTG